jgi:hypothetical protein
MAAALGVFLPLAESVRRFDELLDPARFPAWFDDYVLGALLLLAAYRAAAGKQNSYLWLIGVWGIAVGGLALSLAGHAGSLFIAYAKGFLLIYSLCGLWLGVRAAATPTQP